MKPLRLSPYFMMYVRSMSIKKVQETKKFDGQWQQVDVFEFDDNIPFGHGEKVFI